MTKDEATELFILQLRGRMADAFSKRGISPGEYWPILNGERTMTIRHIGEVGHITGHEFQMGFVERPARQSDAEGEG